jgi:putative photosynthetic complex assembly protein
MSEAKTQGFPLPVLLGAGAMILISLAVAYGARQAHLAAPKVAQRPPLETIDVRFEDRPDGAIAVLEATSGREISVVPPRSNGFIRGVMRGMFRGRKLEALGREGSFRLSREADGRLSLVDPQTGRRIDLDSFGPTNSLAFAQLLAAGRAPQAVAQ